MTEEVHVENTNEQPAAVVQAIPEIPHIVEMKVKGFRGFTETATINFGVPNGKRGSGLTLFVGPNNAGKSSIIESITAIAQPTRNSPTFSEGKRNIKSGDKVSISIKDNAGREKKLTTVSTGGSETDMTPDNTMPSGDQIFIVPSRRTFAPFFGKSSQNRIDYSRLTQKLSATRTGQAAFAQRMFHINSDPTRREKFDEALSKVINPVPDWTIEQSEQGQYYIKVSKFGLSHSSDGLGEGLISILFLVDSIYDSEAGSMIVIDEPELSLHPHLQSKFLEYVLDSTTDRQIVIATHSPKFIDWQAISVGANISRVINEKGVTKVYSLSDRSRNKITGFLEDMNNPHVLGTDANEVFFLVDKVVLFEGQEDVMYFPRVLHDLEYAIDANFYGWGVGGADKMATIASILKDLGFKKLVGILDYDKIENLTPLQAEFSEYLFCAQPADDIRFKEDKPDKTFLLEKGNIKVAEKFIDETKVMLEKINSYLST